MTTSRAASWLRPAQATAGGFVLLILLGTALLMAPWSAASGTATAFLPALFTATSAVSLTGLVVVDTAGYWSHAGQLTIVVLIQLGGLGIMTLTTLTGMLLTGRVSRRARQSLAAEGRPITAGSMRRALLLTVATTLLIEALVTAVLAARFIRTYGLSPGAALWEGLFHAISAFNNAGFSTYPDNLVRFAADAWILLPLAAALILGGLGYPVLAEFIRLTRGSLQRRLAGRAPRVHRISITAAMTLGMTGFLLIVGMLFLALAEWDGVFADMRWDVKLLNSFFHSASPRTAGFNAIDYSATHPVTQLGTCLLMFLGGGSAGTAGGIKVTTTCVLIAAVVAEFRGRPDTVVGDRRIPPTVIRQALAVTCVSLAVVAVGIVALRVCDPQFSADQVSFEVFSAFATVGLSTGITGQLSAASQSVLCAIMYLGRVGPATLVAALAAWQRSSRIRFPEERPFIG